MLMIQAEPTELALASEMPSEVSAGDEILLNVAAQSESGHDLRAAVVEILQLPGHEKLAAASFSALASPSSETGMFAVRAPETLGRHEWLIRFPEQEIDGRLLGESTQRIAFETHPQKTSLAVWAVPSPVLVGARFRIKIGAKSAGGYVLGGARVEVRDESGETLSSGVLVDETWPGTASLYWTELELLAPETEGMVNWTVTCDASEILAPHEHSSARFSFATTRPPNTRLTVRVSESGSGSPVAGATLRLGAHKGATDDNGRSVLEVPDGTYTLTAWKTGYEAASLPLELAQDRDIEIGLTPLPEVKELWM